MKLRIKGNSIRLRLTRPELARLAESGHVEDAIQFGIGAEHRFVYAITVTRDAEALTLHHAPGVITLLLPAPALARWLRPDEVGVEAHQDLDDGQTLSILIEKDFACLDARPGEEDADAFPNPIEGAAC